MQLLPSRLILFNKLNNIIRFFLKWYVLFYLFDFTSKTVLDYSKSKSNWSSFT